MRKYLLIVATVFICVGCSETPYEKGVSLAEEYNKCMSSYFDALSEVGDDFAADLPGSYTSRRVAMDDYQQLLQECHQKYLGTWEQINRKEQKIRKGFKSTADVAEFESALSEYQESRAFCSVPDIETETVPETVRRRVVMIRPQKPTEQQIQNDLVGRSLSEGKSEGYYSQTWKWIIEENSISEFKILEVEEDSDKRYLLNVSMRLSTETRAFDAKAHVCYKLDDINDWTIDFVQSLGMDIVKTHLYDDCIRYHFSWMHDLIVENNCDVSLEVGGKSLNSVGEWVKVCGIIPPHQSQRLAYYSTEFRVDYVERP